MTLGARCADCNKGYRVDERLAGQTLRCKACGGTVAVPNLPAGATPRAKIPVPVPGIRSTEPVAAAAAAPAPDAPFTNMDALLAPEAGDDPCASADDDDAALALAPPPLPRPIRRGGGGSAGRMGPGAAIDPPAYAPRPAPTAPRRRPGWKPAKPDSRPAAANFDAAVPVVLGLMCAGLGGVFLAGHSSDSFRPTALMILLVSGVALMLAGALGCLVTAFRESVVCGLLYLLTPLGLYALYYVFSRLERTKGYLAIYLIGLACAIGGRGLQPRSAAAPDQPLVRWAR